MNEKGFAITGILYSSLILFIIFIVLTIFNLQNKKVILDKLKLDTLDSIEGNINEELIKIEAINITYSKNNQSTVDGALDDLFTKF